MGPGEENKPTGQQWGVGSRLRGSRLKAGIKSGVTANISKDLDALRSAYEAEMVKAAAEQAAAPAEAVAETAAPETSKAPPKMSGQLSKPKLSQQLQKPQLPKQSEQLHKPQLNKQSEQLQKPSLSGNPSLVDEDEATARVRAALERFKSAGLAAAFKPNEPTMADPQPSGAEPITVGPSHSSRSGRATKMRPMPVLDEFDDEEPEVEHSIKPRRPDSDRRGQWSTQEFESPLSRPSPEERLLPEEAYKAEEVAQAKPAGPTNTDESRPPSPLSGQSIKSADQILAEMGHLSQKPISREHPSIAPEPPPVKTGEAGTPPGAKEVIPPSKRPMVQRPPREGTVAADAAVKPLEPRRPLLERLAEQRAARLASKPSPLAARAKPLTGDAPAAEKPDAPVRSETAENVLHMHKVAGGKFFCQADRNGNVVDFWLGEEGAAELPHYKWTGAGYRKYDDAQDKFDSRASTISYPQARVDGRAGFVRADFGAASSYVFHFDGRFEERDLADRLVLDRDERSQQRTYLYQEGRLWGVSIKFLQEPLSAVFAFDAESTTPRKMVGYEYRDDRTGHIEKLEPNSGYWRLSVGDRQYWFPIESRVDVDRFGNRRIKSPAGVLLYEGKLEGYTLVRNESGYLIETTSPDGVLTILTRSADGGVEQIIVVSGQGQIVEHSTFQDGGWDTGDVAEIRVDDTTGVMTIVFATGQEVQRLPDGTQALSGADDEYKLDADRVADLVPLSDEENRFMKADLACVTRFDMNMQSWIYNSIWEIACTTPVPTNLSPEERRHLVMSLAHQCAHPENISQGYKDACVATVAEKCIALLRPDLYSDMTAKLVTTGQYSVNGFNLTAQRRMDGRLAEYSDSSGSRSLTSEVVQTALMRLAMPDGQEYRSYPAGVQTPHGVDRSTDTGERLVVEGKELRFVGPERDALSTILNRLMPECNWVAVPIMNMQALDSAWQSSGMAPPMPICVRIDVPDPVAGSVPFTHAVLVTYIEYNEQGEPNKIYFENTADGDDHSYPGGIGVPIREFVRSMQVRNTSIITGEETVIPPVALIRQGVEQ